MTLDFLATAFFVFHAYVMLGYWLFMQGNMTLLVLLSFICALYDFPYSSLAYMFETNLEFHYRMCHGSIFLRTTLQFLEISRERSRGALSLA